MVFIGISMTFFIALIIGIVIGYLANQRELEEVRKTLRDTRIDLKNIQLGYTDGDKNV